MMKLLKVDESSKGNFIEYCRKFGPEHDESFVMPDELNGKDFVPDDDNLSFMLVDERCSITGAVSLMLKNYRDAGRGRFRILHSVKDDFVLYKQMVDALLPCLQGVKDIYLFIPDDKPQVSSILERLNFKVQRYSCVLVRQNKSEVTPAFPGGYILKPFIKDKDEEAWCNIMNTGFAHLAGHVDTTPDMIRRNIESESYIDGGMQILWHEDKPVGVVRVTRDEEDGEIFGYIDHVALIPSYQGKGLGRNILRAGIEFAQKMGFPTTVLSVHGENTRAFNLYLSEGFEKQKVMICYNMNL